MLSKVKIFHGAMMVGLLLSASTTFAASYYVDYVGGLDSNKGTNTTVAWKHCPGDAVATGTAAATSLAPGDTVYFKGGVSYILANSIMVKTNGTTGNPITYDGNTAGTWGTGRAIFTSPNALIAFLAPGSLTNVNFRSLELGPIGGATTLPADTGVALPAKNGVGIYSMGAMSSVKIDNCYFHELGYWQNQKPVGPGSIDGVGLRCLDSVGLTITNCEFTKVARACEMQSQIITTNLVIANCKFHDYIVWCIDLCVQANGCQRDGIYIHDCQFINNDWAYDANHWTGYDTGPHQDGIFDRTDSVGFFRDGTNINFYNNLFQTTVPNTIGGTACMYLETGPQANIYNNVFLYHPVANACITYACANRGQEPSTTLRIYNNTFALNGGYPGITISGEEANNFDRLWDTNCLIYVQNNVFADFTTNNNNNSSLVLNTANTEVRSYLFFDYNCYLSYDGYVSPYFKNDTHAFLNSPGVFGQFGLAGMRFNGWETNGMAANPIFINGGFTGSDLHLQTNSPCLTVGKNLSAVKLSGLSGDLDGKSRPTTGAWAMGAYQTSTAAVVPPVIPAPKPATGLRMTN